jgi:hypothetical protein
VEWGWWKLVRRAETTRQRWPGRINSEVRPSSRFVAAADSSARTLVVPTATTRRARRQASMVAAGTR